MAEKLYGVADRTWQVVVGCDPHMSCAPRCWARRTIARVVSCQGDSERGDFFAKSLSPDGQKWSGKVLLDELHLRDPLSWKKPALIATGFHGDWGRLEASNKHLVAAIMALCPQHTFMLLTKCPDDVVGWCDLLQDIADGWKPKTQTGEFSSADVLNLNWMHFTLGHGPAFPYHEWPFKNVTLGCSIMNQSEADAHRRPMQKLAAMGWGTHVWYEPALGPVDWTGWEHVSAIIAGGESGPDARAAHPDWFRSTRDWCLKNDAKFVFKQWGEWAPGVEMIDKLHPLYGKVEQKSVQLNPANRNPCAIYERMTRVGKKAAGCQLNGVEWKALPEAW